MSLFVGGGVAGLYAARRFLLEEASTAAFVRFSMATEMR